MAARWRSTSTSLLLALLCLPGCGPAADGAADLVLYSPEKEDYVQQLVDAFEAETGLAVRYDHLGSTGAVFGKLRAEAAHPQADVVYGGGGPAPFVHAAGQGLLEPYVPAAWVDRPDRLGNVQVRDPDGFWFGFEQFVLGFAFNEDLIDEAEVPTRWEELADERWKGRLMLPSPAASGTATLTLLAHLYRAGGTPPPPLDQDHPGWAFWDRLYPLVVSFTDSGYGPTQAVAKGEVPVGVGFAFMAYTLRAEQKARIGFVVPLETPVVVNPAALVAGAPHGENGRRFLDWLASSRAAAEVAARWFRTPLLPEVPSPTGLPLEETAARAFPVDVRWLGEHYELGRRLFRERYP